MNIKVILFCLAILVVLNSAEINIDNIDHPSIFLTENINTLTDEQLYFHFHKLMQKNYQISSEEGLKRFKIFQSNLQEIREFNLDTTNTYKKGVTIYTDLTQREFLEDRNMVVEHFIESHEKKVDLLTEQQMRFLKENKMEKDGKLGDFFKPIDWRAQGAVNPPTKSPSNCPSTSHMSYVAAIETCNWVKTKQLLKLSNQQVIDCFKPCTTFGSLYDYRYFMTNALQSDASYPYDGKGAKTCKYSPSSAYVKPTSFNYSFSMYVIDTETSYAALKHCPYVAIQGFTTPRDYVSGVYNPPDCNGTGTFYGLVTVVGYGIDAGVDYWIINNHYGTNWGEKGFMKVKRRDESKGCGLTSEFFSRPSFD